jgi:septum formation protein
MTSRLILASSSPRRHELVERLGLPFEVVVPIGVDEKAVRGTACEVCQERALRKARAVLADLDEARDAVVVGCDTVVAVVRGGEEQILGKPETPKEARRMLRVLSGVTHRVLSGVALASVATPERVEVEISHVTFKALTDEEIDAYVATGEPLDKAGGYGIQSVAGALVVGIRGCYYNVVGLPLVLLSRMLGIDPPCACDCRRHPLQRGRGGCEPRAAQE